MAPQQWSYMVIQGCHVHVQSFSGLLGPQKITALGSAARGGPTLEAFGFGLWQQTGPADPI